jgi:hypothetical protein
MLIKSCVNHYISLSFLRKKPLNKYVDVFLACQKSKVTIKLKFYYSNLKNAVETAKIAVDSCYVPRQFLTPLPSIDFREIRGLVQTTGSACYHVAFVVIKQYDQHPVTMTASQVS